MHFSNQVFFGILAFFAKATGRLNSYFRLKVMSLKNYEKKYNKYRYGAFFGAKFCYHYNQGREKS